MRHKRGKIDGSSDEVEELVKMKGREAEYEMKKEETDGRKM